MLNVESLRPLIQRDTPTPEVTRKDQVFNFLSQFQRLYPGVLVPPKVAIAFLRIPRSTFYLYLAKFSESSTLPITVRARARARDREVEEAIHQGKTVTESTLTKSQLQSSRSRLIRQGRIKSSKLSPEELAQRDVQIKDDHYQGCGDKKTAQRLRINVTTVSSRKAIFRARGEIGGLRRKKRTEDTLKIFDQMVCDLVEEDYEYDEIADILDVEKYHVMSVIQRLRKSGVLS